MSLTNPKRFGLNVLSFLTDVQDKTTALRNINLPLPDLDVIRGSSNAGGDRHDWISFSRLSVPIHKTLARFSADSEVFTSALDNRAGIRGILFGGLDINGILSGNAIRYRYVDGVGGSAQVKIADISTSRASAWSSSDPNADTDPTAVISYGAQVKVNGDLRFGTSSISGKKLRTSQSAQIREFDSEIPTHKMKIKLNSGNDYANNDLKEVYLMKGIPLIFRGFFRNLNADIEISQINNIPASWKIVERDNPNAYVNFANLGSSVSQLRFRSSRSKERFIQFYYNPDNIKKITLTGAQLEEIPPVKLAILTELNLSSNIFRNFPDLNFATPALRVLNLASNQFYLSETKSERALHTTLNGGYTTGTTTGTALDKIPTSVTSINIGSAFRGSITPNIFAGRFPNLISLGLSGGHYPDNVNTSNPLPNVSNTVESYTVTNTDFRAFTPTNTSNNQYNIKDLTNLVNLNLSGGTYYLGDATFSLSCGSTIKTINLHNTGLPIPIGLVGSQTLESFDGSYMRAAGTFFSGNTYKFANCVALTSLNFSHSGISGAFPIFSNPELRSLNLNYTNISGGSLTDSNFAIPSNIFQNTPKLSYFSVISSSLSTNPIHPDAFTGLNQLGTLQYYSYGRTTGSIPNVNGLTSLSGLYLSRNAFTGTPPALSSLSNLYQVDLSFNQLTGSTPEYRNLGSLQFLYLHNNNLTGLGNLVNLQQLRRFYAHNNSITGTIPNFSECPRLDYLILYNNQFTDYTSGSFSGLTRVRYIDVSGNSLTQQAVDQILIDSLANYNSAARRGVTINLRNNATPSESGQENVLLLRSKGWNITHS